MGAVRSGPDRAEVILPQEEWAAWLGEEVASADKLRAIAGRGLSLRSVCWGEPPTVARD